MDVDPVALSIDHSNLLGVRELDSGRFEFLSLAWDAAGELTSSDLATRRAGLERLIELQAARNSSLMAYLLFTRLTETDIELRARVIRALADVLGPDEGGQLAAGSARASLIAYLAGMRTRPIFALLQAVEAEPSVEPMVIDLLGYCSFAGAHLAEILMDRSAPLAIRKQAVRLVGSIGYLDALPALERLSARLESRKNGNNGLLGDKVDANDEASLLPLIENALNSLRSP